MLIRWRDINCSLSHHGYLSFASKPSRVCFFVNSKCLVAMEPKGMALRSRRAPQFAEVFRYQATTQEIQVKQLSRDWSPVHGVGWLGEDVSFFTTVETTQNESRQWWAVTFSSTRSGKAFSVQETQTGNRRWRRHRGSSVEAHETGFSALGEIRPAKI